MFFDFEPNFIENSFWKVVLQVWSRDFFLEELFLAAILKRNNVWIVLFADIMVIVGVYTYGESFVPKFLRKSTQKKINGFKWTPLVHKLE